jgi:ATP-dependent Lon protease
VALERKPVPLTDEEAAVVPVSADKGAAAVASDSLKH